MIYLQIPSQPTDVEPISIISWLLLFLIIGIVVYRILNDPVLRQSIFKKKESDDTVQRGKKSPLESLLRNLVRGLDGQLINSARFKSPLLAAIFTKTQLRITTFALILVAVLFILGAWEGGLLALGIVALALWGHSSQYTYVWKKEEGGKDILTGLYWYYKDSEKSLQYLMKASEVNNDPFMAYLIAEELKSIESWKPEEERSYSEAIYWYERVVERSKYDIRESLNSLNSLKIQEGQYEDALRHLDTLKDEYEVESPMRYSAAYFGIGEENELQCKLDEAIEYYKQALEIFPELQSNIPCIITSKLTFLYSRIGEFDNSKTTAEQLLKFYLAGEFQNKLSTSNQTFNEFIEEISYPFKCTADIEGFVTMLSQGINSNTSEEMAVKFQSYLVKFLRRAGRIEQAEVFEQNLLKNHEKNIHYDRGFDHLKSAQSQLKKPSSVITDMENLELYRMGYYDRFFENLKYLFDNNEDIQAKDYHHILLGFSLSRWEWDQVITICDEGLAEEDQNNIYHYYRALIKALLYKGKLDEALVNLGSLIELQNQDNSFGLPDEDFHLFARLYQADCQKGKAIKIYEMWMAKENKGSYISEDKIRWIKKKIQQLS